MPESNSMRPPGSDARFSPSFWLGLLAVVVAAAALCDIRATLPLVFFGGLVVVALVAGKVPFRRLWRLIPLVSFGLFGLLVLIVAPAPEGAEVISLPLRLEMPRHGTDMLINLLIKSGFIVLLVTAWAERLSERDRLAGLIGLHLPRRAVSLLYMMVRSIHTIEQQVRSLIRARDARGRPGGIRAVKVLAAMTEVLLIRLGLKAERQGFALCARGYTGHLALSGYEEISAVELGVLVLSAVGLIWLTI